MAADFDLVMGGPADFQLAAVTLGHTFGGITATISPQNREVNVDKFGSSPVNVRHTGERVSCNVPLAEIVAAQIAEILESGSDQTAAMTAKYMGAGRSAGYIHTAQNLLIIPFLTADAQKQVELMRATAVGEFTVGFSVDDDRVHEVEFLALVDEALTDGELVAKINLTTS